MKSIKSLLTRLAVVAGLLGMTLIGTGCQTTYDASGRPVQSVDPALAVAGIAAAGLAGYAIGNNNNDRYYRRGYGGGYGYGGHYYRPTGGHAYRGRGCRY